jgi:hypothetical protein
VYTRLRIEAFRGLRSVVLDGLKRVNLIVGRNNSGKTSLLEAAFLMSCATNTNYPILLPSLRGQRFAGSSVDPIWRPLFPDMNAESPIRLSARLAGEDGDRALSITALGAKSRYVGEGFSEGLELMPDNGSFEIGGLGVRYRSAIGDEWDTETRYVSGSIEMSGRSPHRDFMPGAFVSPGRSPSLERSAQWFSHLIKLKRDEEIVAAMRIVEPRLQRIEIVSEPGGPAVYVDVGLPSLIPITASGEGVVRLFSMLVALASAGNGILLVDEIESGLHHSVMNKLWTALARMAEQQNVQVFATTHSDEMIRSALETLASHEDTLALYRIDALPDGRHRVAAYDSEAMAGVIAGNFEVRA